MRKFYFLILSSVFLPYSTLKAQNEKFLLTVLGTVQDAGSPQMACQKSCCANLSEAEMSRRKVSSLALTTENKSAYLFDASPAIAHQFHSLQLQGVSELAGIFLTHAHMGHMPDCYNWAAKPGIAYRCLFLRCLGWLLFSKETLLGNNYLDWKISNLTF